VDIAAWLHELGLEQYEAAFRDNAIDAAILPELTDDDLKDLGVNWSGTGQRTQATCLRRSTAGSRRVSIRLISERRKPCSTNSANRQNNGDYRGNGCHCALDHVPGTFIGPACAM
jgi:SAM domain (Sterile alpha motif)